MNERRKSSTAIATTTTATARKKINFWYDLRTEEEEENRSNNIEMKIAKFLNHSKIERTAICDDLWWKQKKSKSNKIFIKISILFWLCKHLSTAFTYMHIHLNTHTPNVCVCVCDILLWSSPSISLHICRVPKLVNCSCKKSRVRMKY